MQEMPSSQSKDTDIGTKDTLPSERNPVSNSGVESSRFESDTLASAPSPKIEIARGSGLTEGTREAHVRLDKLTAGQFVEGNEEYLREYVKGLGLDYDKIRKAKESKPEPKESGIIASLRDRISRVFTKPKSAPVAQEVPVVQETSRATLETPISQKALDGVQEFMQVIPDKEDRETIARILNKVKSGRSSQPESEKKKAA